MSSLIQNLLSYPVVVFTMMMGVVLFYWFFVVVGALDIDVLEAEGLFEGADTALDGTLDGALDGIDGVEGVDLDVDAAGGNVGLLNALNLRRAPVTVVFSLLAFFGWILSYVALRTVMPLATAVMPSWLAGSLVLVLVLLVALPLTSLATKPLASIFRDNQGKRRADFVGQVCKVRTGRVDAGFGQADLEDGGAGLVIQVRGDGAFKRGQRALIVDYDAEREAYLVEAYDEILGEHDGEGSSSSR